MRKQIAKLYTVILSVGAAYYLLIQVTGISIPCLYYKTTGLLCPGCGTTRMFLALARLDIAAAFSHNPVMFVLFFLWNLIALLCCLKAKWAVFFQSKKFLYTVFWLSVAALWIFCIIRNIT